MTSQFQPQELTALMKIESCDGSIKISQNLFERSAPSRKRKISAHYFATVSKGRCNGGIQTETFYRFDFFDTP
jgi:hypothetical protein